MLTAVKENKNKQKKSAVRHYQNEREKKKSSWTEFFIKVSTVFYRFLVFFIIKQNVSFL